MKQILIIEDDLAIQKGLEKILKTESYAILKASDGIEGYTLAQHKDVKLIILDIMLPNKNGLDICRDLRSNGINTPILMLTSKSEEIDKVEGLEVGADDYMTKPFSINEFRAGYHYGNVSRGKVGINKKEVLYSIQMSSGN